MLLAARDLMLADSAPVENPYISDITQAAANEFAYAWADDASYTSYTFTDLATIDANAFDHAFSGNAAKSISFYRSDGGAMSLKSNALEAFAAIDDGEGETLESISFTSLYYCRLADYTFKDGCKNQTALTSASFPNLQGIGGFIVSKIVGKRIQQVWEDHVGFFQGCFAGCTSLTTLTFPALSWIASNDHFADNDCLEVINLPAYDAQYADKTTSLFSGCTNLVEIHFGAANQAAIEAASGYASKWGAPNANCQIYFDL